MSRLASSSHATWTTSTTPAASVAPLLEQGRVVCLPNLAFEVAPAERHIFSPAILSSSKNTSYDPSTDQVGGTSLTGAPRDQLRDVLRRFSMSAADLVEQLLPEYRGRMVRKRASFRPAEIAGRQTSWRKDDTRLHLDAFPTSPTHGDRILRVFSNVNPEGRARTWRVGEDAEDVIRRFASTLSLPFPGLNALLAAVRLTKSARTPYDTLMLQLHDRMKQDTNYQESSPQERVDLPAGTTWMTFTDQVGHAAMAGQYQFEQTFLLPVVVMIDDSRSPLRILEKTLNKRLA
ncbi:MAG: Kdo hydroxylase family protein [Vicinamibacterales bacterium]